MSLVLSRWCTVALRRLAVIGSPAISVSVAVQMNTCGVTALKHLDTMYSYADKGAVPAKGCPLQRPLSLYTAQQHWTVTDALYLTEHLGLRHYTT